MPPMKSVRIVLGVIHHDHSEAKSFLIEEEVHDSLVGGKARSAQLAPLHLRVQIFFVKKAAKGLGDFGFAAAGHPQAADGHKTGLGPAIVSAFVTVNHVLHQSPKPFFRASTPSAHRRSSVPLGYRAQSDWASRQNFGSLPTPSSTRKRRKASPRPAANRIIAWCSRSSVVLPGFAALWSVHPLSTCSSSSSNPGRESCADFFRFAAGDSVPSLPNRAFVRSATGNKRAVSPLTSTRVTNCSRWTPKPWAIFRAASYSSTKPEDFAFFVTFSSDSSPSSSASSASSPLPPASPGDSVHSHMAVSLASSSNPVVSAPAKIIDKASRDTAAQTCSRYSLSWTTSPFGFSTREYREKPTSAGPRQAKMASAPTTPSRCNRGIHSCIRRGSSAKTSRQSPT